MNVLVDTPIWSLALRWKRAQLSAADRELEAELADLIRGGRAVLVGPVRQEILSGIREQSTLERVRQRLRAFEDVRLQTEDFEQAARFFNTCRSRGVAATATDLAICAAADRLNLAIFTTDRDFAHYARCLPVRLHKAGKRI